MKNILAIILLFSSVVSFPQERNENYILAIADIQKENYTEAINLLDALINQEPQEEKYYLQRGKALYSSGVYDAAKNDFLQANKLKSNIASFELAKTYAELNEPDLMLAELENHLKSQYKKDKAVILSDDSFKAYEREKIWEDFWKQDWYNSQELLIDEIGYHLKYEDYNEALTKAGQRLKKSKNNHRIMALKGEALAALGDHPGAIKSFSDAIKLNKRTEKYYIQRAKSYIETEKYKNASEDLETALNLNPANFENYKTLAEVYALSGNIEKAEENLNYYLTFFEEDKDATFLFGKIYIKANQPLKALPYLNECLENDKTNPDYFTQRANAYLQTKTYQYAIKDYSMSLDLEPNNAEAYLNKGIARQKTGDQKGACSDWQKAYKLGSKKALEYLLESCQ